MFVDTVVKFVLAKSDKQVIISKLGETLSFGASPTETSLSQSIAESQEKNFKLNSSLSFKCASIHSVESIWILIVSNSSVTFLKLSFILLIGLIYAIRKDVLKWES